VDIGMVADTDITADDMHNTAHRALIKHHRAEAKTGRRLTGTAELRYDAMRKV
jgi:hypothetical protein